MSDGLRFSDVPPASGGGAFDVPGYLAASARHTGSTPVYAASGDAGLALLRADDGSLRTVYGYPHGLGAPDGFDALAAALVAHGGAWLALAPFGPGAELAAALERRLPPADVRPICVAEPAGDDGLATFSSRARRAARTARNRGGAVAVATLEPWFGGFYRAAMAQLEAQAVYRFDDAYFAELAGQSHYVVRVDDEHGPAAAMLWLLDDGAAWYHLGGRRPDPAPVVGAMNLCTAEGLAEAGRRGLRLAVLGGGRGTGTDDALFAFKRQMAGAVLPRPVFELPPRA
jgi:hypothetical protein